MGLLDVNHPLVMVFGILGNLVSMAVLFSPMTIFHKIYKRKSTMEYSSLPYVVSLFSALLWIYYALLKKGGVFFILSINSLAAFIQCVYLIIFLVYASSQAKKQTLKNLSAVVTLCVAIYLVSSFLVATSRQLLVVGWICVAVSVRVFAAPLSNVIRVIRTRNIRSMPFPLSCFLTLSSIMWFAYGLVIVDIFISVPNVFGFVLGMIQIILYQYYKRRSTALSNNPEIDMSG